MTGASPVANRRIAPEPRSQYLVRMSRHLLVAIVAAALGACFPSRAEPPPPAASAEAPPYPLGSAADADSLLMDIRTLDSTIIVDLRYATRNNFMRAPLPGYVANRALLRREAAVALARVQRRLADEALLLRVFDAYRPVRATMAMVEWTSRSDRSDLLRDGYIATRSRHNLGLAVDLTLVDAVTGRELDMGTGFDTFTAAAHTSNASGLVAVNRQRLVRAMVVEGFSNYDREWWHFSYTADPALRFDVDVR